MSNQDLRHKLVARLRRMASFARPPRDEDHDLRGEILVSEADVNALIKAADALDAPALATRLTSKNWPADELPASLRDCADYNRNDQLGTAALCLSAADHIDALKIERAMLGQEVKTLRARLSEAERHRDDAVAQRDEVKLQRDAASLKVWNMNLARRLRETQVARRACLPPQTPERTPHRLCLKYGHQWTVQTECCWMFMECERCSWRTRAWLTLLECSTSRRIDRDTSRANGGAG